MKTLNERAAKCLGWTFIEDVRLAGTVWETDCSHWIYTNKDGRHETFYEPEFTENLDHALLLEDEIERRGLQDEYVQKLADILPISSLDEATIRWTTLITATPAQRTQAAVEVLEAMG